MRTVLRSLVTTVALAAFAVQSLPRNLKGRLPTVAEIEAEIGNTRTKQHGS